MSNSWVSSGSTDTVTASIELGRVAFAKFTARTVGLLMPLTTITARTRLGNTFRSLGLTAISVSTLR